MSLDPIHATDERSAISAYVDVKLGTAFIGFGALAAFLLDKSNLSVLFDLAILIVSLIGFWTTKSKYILYFGLSEFLLRMVWLLLR